MTSNRYRSSRHVHKCCTSRKTCSIERGVFSGIFDPSSRRSKRTSIFFLGKAIRAVVRARVNGDDMTNSTESNADELNRKGIRAASCSPLGVNPQSRNRESSFRFIPFFFATCPQDCPCRIRYIVFVGFFGSGDDISVPSSRRRILLDDRVGDDV